MDNSTFFNFLVLVSKKKYIMPSNRIKDHKNSMLFEK